MFRKVKNWVRGNDQKFTTGANGSKSKINQKKAKLHKNKNNISNSRNNLSNSRLQLDDPDDGFKRHNIDGFDLVLTTENKNDDVVLDEPTSITADIEQTRKSQEIEISSIKSTDEEEQETSEHQPEVDSIGDSGCDVLTPSSVDTLAEQTEQMDAFETSKLDEMETLELFDSVVNDLDDDIESLNENDTNETEVDDDNTNFLDKHSNADSRSSNPINYNEVVGEYPDSNGSTSTTENNWKVTGFSKQKVLHFKHKDMYLPSPNSTRTPERNSVAPELPPPDYPQSDDDLDEENVVRKETAQPVETTNLNKDSPITSFSKRSIIDLTKITEEEKPDVAKTATTNGKINSDSNNKIFANKNITFESSVNSTSSTSSFSSNSLSNSSGSGNFITTSSPRAKKRPRPRVTSFKAETPKVLSAKPVNDLVKKFEGFHHKGESF